MKAILTVAALVAVGFVSAADAQTCSTVWTARMTPGETGCVSAADVQNTITSEEFTNLFGNQNQAYLWSDGTTMWVTDRANNEIYAIKMSDRSYVTKFSVIQSPRGIWSDGNTMWVVRSSDTTAYAYDISNKANIQRDSAKDFNLHTDNDVAQGIFSVRSTLYVADYFDNKIYAYHMSDKSRDSDKDIALGFTPRGIWSDGSTMWVAEDSKPKIHAFRLSDGGRDGSKEIALVSVPSIINHYRNTSPEGIWSNCRTMWVAESGDRVIYAYRMPAGTICPQSSSGTYVYTPPTIDTTPPHILSVERTGNATTTNRTLTWDVTFNEPVVVGGMDVSFRTNGTSVANAAIPDLGMARDTITVDVPGAVTGGSISVDLHHPITSGLLIELIAPDCTRFTIHNQTTTFLYKLRQPNDLGDLAGVGAAGQWTLHVSDHKERHNGTLNSWSLELESDGIIEGGWRWYAVTQYAAGPGNYTLSSLDGYDIRDRSGNRLMTDVEPAVNEPYLVEGEVRTCRTE